MLKSLWAVQLLSQLFCLHSTKVVIDKMREELYSSTTLLTKAGSSAHLDAGCSWPTPALGSYVRTGVGETRKRDGQGGKMRDHPLQERRMKTSRICKPDRVKWVL